MVSHGSLFCSNIGPIKDDLRQFASIYVTPFSIYVNLRQSIFDLRQVAFDLRHFAVDLRQIAFDLRQFPSIYVQVW